MDFFSEMRKKHDSLKDSELEAVMEEGAKKARAVAGPKMEVVKKAVGLL
jgi:hypothetical protein